MINFVDTRRPSTKMFIMNCTQEQMLLNNDLKKFFIHLGYNAKLKRRLQYQPILMFDT